MHLCLIATTRGRDYALLERFFSSLARQEYRDFELILGDQNLPGHIDPLLQKYERLFPCKRFFLAPCGLSEARNRLLTMATGEYVILADDDCHYAPDSFARMVCYAERYPEAAALIAQGSPETDAFPAAKLESPTRLSRYGVFKNAPSWCIFLRRDALITVGPFDEDMGIGAPTPWQSGEETDILLRLITAGKAVYRAPSIRVFHDALPATDSTLVKIEAYGMGRMYLLRKQGFPIWFRLVNIIYPLCVLILEFPRHRLNAVRSRLAVFKGRIKGFISNIKIPK